MIDISYLQFRISFVGSIHLQLNFVHHIDWLAAIHQSLNRLRPLPMFNLKGDILSATTLVLIVKRA